MSALLHSQYLDPPSYTFLRTIGEGAGGPCRLHWHEVLKIWVVSKTVSLLPVSGGIATGEPELLEAIRHDRIVRLREAQWTPGKPKSLKHVTFTTDYCEGRSVDTALAEGHRFSTSEALRITADVLAALVHLHETHGIVHRDVKPGNVMLDGLRQRGLLGDLGSAAMADADGRVAAGAGTIFFQSPEAHAGSIDHSADLYGLGMVLLEMLNGPLPYDTFDFDNIEDRLEKGQRSLPDRYFAPGPWVPPPVASVVRKLTAKRPQDRPASATEAQRLVLDALSVDWRRETEGDGLVGRWLGTWPPTAPTARRRALEVQVEPILSGKFKGMLYLTARSRSSGGGWRSYARLATREAANDSRAVARFFRAVERAAQRVAAR